VYPGGVQGDDSVVLRKLRVGQLQAAGLATQGIGAVYPDLLALSVPFLFEDYDEIDHVLAEMDGFWTAGLRARGYVLLGWTDIGYVHLLSQVPVARVADIAGRKVWRPSQDPLTGVLFSRAGVVSVPLAVPDVLLGLQSGMVDVVYAPPAAAIAMQWFTRVKYVTELPINYVMGAFVIAEEPFSRLTPAQQELLLESSRRHLRAATLAARKANAEALAVMRRHGLELVTPAPGDVAAFRELVTTCLPEWLDVAFSRAAFARIEACLAAYRQREVSTP